MDVRYNFFERLVYQGVGGQRFTQDSPVMPDVWIRYGMHSHEPGDKRLSLLLTPNNEVTPGELAKKLRRAFRDYGSVEGPPSPKEIDEGPRIAYNQTVVVADLLFHELLCIALPQSAWWEKFFVKGDGREHAKYLATPEMRDRLEQLFLNAFSRPSYVPREGEPSVHIVWLARVIGTIAFVHRFPQIEIQESALYLPHDVEGLSKEDIQDPTRLHQHILQAAFGLLEGVAKPKPSATPPLWSVNRNRKTIASLNDSGPAVKADAARRVFEVSGHGITWAILDSGIDALHVAFRKREAKTGEPKSPAFKKKRSRWTNQTRVRETYDFVKIRDLLSTDPETGEGLPEAILKKATRREESDLRRVLKNGRVLDWEILRPWLQIPHTGDGRYRPPKHPHGTHVAGILAADWRPDDQEAGDDAVDPPDGTVVGIAPEIELIDLRVLDDRGRTDEFSLMSGMQFIRHLNATHDLRQVHGANLSFSLRHDFTVFACGQTPVCQEAERLIGNGTVVVAAAGNEGMARYQGLDDRVESGYRSISITDPGNAEKVITVGATHRRDPHTYGVSYFSSRGPTGDGRRKPDLVAPGEKITSPWPDHGIGEMDGTSQAAPHVSGAAALLMTRNPELIGQPDFIKRILCDTATDLGRERYFQGAGMLDILRALQSI